MAQNGVVFNNAFTPTPVCSPGRACLLTGLTASQHGVHDWIAMHDPECQERDWLVGQLTLSEILSHSGYRCGLSEKWQTGQDYQCPRGYYWYFGFAMQGDHEGITTYVKEGRAQVRRGTVTEYVTDEAIGFLGTCDSSQPFFPHVGYTDTHSPYVGQNPELVERFSDTIFDDIEVGEPHPFSWNEGIPEGAEIAEEDIRLRHANQYAAVADIDRHIDRIVTHLESADHRWGFPCCYRSPYTCMTSPIPRRVHWAHLCSSFPVAAAFPERQTGRHPRYLFRGLLSVHSRYGLHTRRVD